MKRRIFNILAAISLVLCLATAGLWVRSYWRWDGVGHMSVFPARAAWTMGGLFSNRGTLFCNRWVCSALSHSARVPSSWGWYAHSGGAIPAANLSRGAYGGISSFMGFGYVHDRRTFLAGAGSERDELTALGIPDWFLVLVFALVPVRWLIIKRREIGRRPPHLCKNCGYDLRATPEADGPLLERCPECGGKVETITKTRKSEASHEGR